MGGGGGGPLAIVQINTFRVGEEALAACFVTYSTHRGVLSAFRFDAPLRAHYDLLPHALFKFALTKTINIMSTVGPLSEQWALRSRPGCPPPPPPPHVYALKASSIIGLPRYIAVKHGCLRLDTRFIIRQYSTA